MSTLIEFLRRCDFSQNDSFSVHKYGRFGPGGAIVVDPSDARLLTANDGPLRVGDVMIRGAGYLEWRLVVVGVDQSHPVNHYEPTWPGLVVYRPNPGMLDLVMNIARRSPMLTFRSTNSRPLPLP